MRLRIRDHRGLHGPITVEGHNMKLGAGGIREIEFFTQTRQLIAGGRDPALARPHHGGRAGGAGRQGLGSGRGGRGADRRFTARTARWSIGCRW